MPQAAPIEFDEPLVFVGGSSVNWQELKVMGHFPIIAVDGGGNDLHAHGLSPRYLCGDFDSVTPEMRQELQREGAQIVALPDQNHTDFAKALSHFQSPMVFAFGFLEGRLDHSLDALAQIAAHSERRIYLIGENDVAFVFPPKGELPLKAGTRISFWSAGEAQIAQATGLKWSMDAMTISASTMSISNEVEGGGVSVDYAGDPLIAILPNSAIDFGL